MATQPKTFDPSRVIYTPQEVSDIGLKTAEDIHAAIEAGKTGNSVIRGLSFPVPGISDYFAPLRPGEIAAIQGQPSNFKSTFIRLWERQAAIQLMHEGRTGESIVHISCEEGIEDIAIQEFAAEIGIGAEMIVRGEIMDWSQIQHAAIRVAGIPIYRIGDSLARADNADLYLSNMIRAVDHIRNGKLTGSPEEIAALFIDYLQAFPIDPEIRKGGDFSQQRRLQVREDIFRLRKAAKYLHCPIIVAIQAKEELQGARGDLLMPGLFDGQETSAIAQRFDRMVSMTMPKMNMPLGEELKVGGYRYDVTEDLLFVKVNKQRGPGLKSGRMWACRVEWNTMTVTIDPSAGRQEERTLGQIKRERSRVYGQNQDDD
jgi:hypothetical protein